VTCRALTDFLVDYLDGTLGADERARFDAHLAECPNCVAYLHAYRETIRLGRAVCREEHDAVGDAVPEELVASILAARRRGS
jgi:anti-sigma factor RsiW